MMTKFAKPYFVLTDKLKANAVTGFYPDQVATAYGFPTGVSPVGIKVGIVELGGQYYPSDLEAFCKARNLVQCPVTVYQVNGATITADPGGADVEVMLDVENVNAAFPGVQINLYFCDNTEQGFVAGITEALNQCDVVSISWGAPEDQWTSSGLASMSAAIKASTTPCFVAAGDNGSSDGESGKHVDFPASAAASIGCGGTALTLTANGAVSSETAWSDGGGGISAQIPIPSYQSGISLLKNLRGVPDICGCADPNTPYNVYCNEQWLQVGGTSAVAPLMAGLFALVKKLNGSLPSPLQTVLYTPNVCRDITSGSNGAYKAGTGYDFCTGMGVPIPSKLLVSASPPVPSPAPSPPPSPPPVKSPPSETVLQQILDSVFAFLIGLEAGNPEAVLFLKDLQEAIDSEIPILLGSNSITDFNLRILYKLYQARKKRG